MIFSPNYYEAIQSPNVKLVTDGIERVEAKGVRLEDGRLIELDLLVLATGFRADRFMRPMELIGRNGIKLEEVWAKRPQAYLSISIPDFPNFFMLNGPNGPVGNFSLIDIAERQMEYIEQLIDLVRSGRCREVSASSEAMRRFDVERIEAAKKTIWATGCKSWYLDAEGVPASWPFSQKRFQQEMSRPQLEDYDLVEWRPRGMSGALMKYHDQIYEKSDHIATITFDNPKKLNAMTGLCSPPSPRPSSRFGRTMTYGIKLEETRVSENVPFNIVVSPSHP